MTGGKTTVTGVRDGDDDRNGDQLAERAGRAAGVQRSVQVTTPLGHQYESEPPPLLGWGSQSPPWATSRTRAQEALRESADAEPRSDAQDSAGARGCAYASTPCPSPGQLAGDRANGRFDASE